MPDENERKPSPVLTWLKNAMLPAARVHASRQITALAAVGAATSGFNLVEPIDLPAQVFRYFCLAMGIAAIVWLIHLIFFPPDNR